MDGVLFQLDLNEYNFIYFFANLLIQNSCINSVLFV